MDVTTRTGRNRLRSYVVVVVVAAVKFTFILLKISADFKKIFLGSVTGEVIMYFQTKNHGVSYLYTYLLKASVLKMFVDVTFVFKNDFLS